MTAPTELRNRLMTQRQALLARETRMQQRVRRAVPQDFAEQAAEVGDDEVVEALGASGREELDAIDRAIGRVDAGTYGVCIHCGDPIDERRLAALPATELCRACAGR